MSMSVVLYMAQFVEDNNPEPSTLTYSKLPEPEEMRHICLEDAVLQDLLVRVRKLEDRVFDLEHKQEETHENDTRGTR